MGQTRSPHPNISHTLTSVTTYAHTHQITESEPAWALFGDDKEDSVQRVGVRIVKVPVKENSVFIGAVKLPRSPARACFADTLRTPCIMVEKGGSVYRTGMCVCD